MQELTKAMNDPNVRNGAELLKQLYDRTIGNPSNNTFDNLRQIT
jgi:hypothetical protein